MPSGKGDGFTGAQREFMDDLVPTFLGKTAYGKTATPGAALPKDDDDLSTWITDRLHEFEAKFADDLTSSEARPPNEIRKVSDQDVSDRL
jgi:hypothetical protein